MKVEILFLTIERWHCIDLILENLKRAEMPEETQILCVCSGSQQYKDYVHSKLKEIFQKVNFIENKEQGIDHSDIRDTLDGKWTGSIANMDKLEKVQNAYTLLIDNIDSSSDYFWFIEDDTLFPLNSFARHKKVMDETKCHITSGISYFWHNLNQEPRNFWNLEVTKVFGGKDSSVETTFDLTQMKAQEQGVIQLGATGLGNVLAKKEAVLNWKPRKYNNIGSGADISFFYNAYLKGYSAYGIWDLFLPHITKFKNGDIQILGRLDKSLVPIITGGITEKTYKEIDKIYGWFSKENLENLSITNLKISPESVILELGSHSGRSTRALRRLYPKADITTVEPHIEVDLSDLKVKQIKDYGYKINWGRLIDLLFIDDDHQYETVKKDINKFKPLISKGGWMVFHDYGNPRFQGVKKAVDELLPDAKIVGKNNPMAMWQKI